MNRPMFELTQQQLKKCRTVEMPTDEQFKESWKKDHHGKVTGWGMGKRNFILSEMKFTPEYQRGIWQGRIDQANGFEYSEERIDAPYNLGYYRGYTGNLGGGIIIPEQYIINKETA
jgi:hypothetical protein